MHSPLISVSAGDEIYGSVSGLNCDANTGVCRDWYIQTQNTRTGAITDLVTTAYGDVENWLFGAALEAYDVTHCAQYPSNGRAFFHHITHTTVNGDHSDFPWTSSVYNVSPWCANDVSAPDASAVTMTWAPTLRPTPAYVDDCRDVHAGWNHPRGARVLL